MKILSAPIKVGINITDYCNLDCIHCLASSRSSTTNELSTSEIINLIDKLADMGVFGILLSGGEPTLHKDFLNICKYAKEKGLGVSFSTNATTLNKEKVKRLKEINIKHIQVSLNASRAEIHDYLANTKGAFRKTINGINNIVEQKIDIQIASVISKINYDEVPHLLKLSQELRVNSFRAMVFMPAGRGKNLINEMLNFEDMKNLVKFLDEQKKLLSGIIEVEFDHPFIPPRKMPEKEELSEADAYFLGCQAGKMECRILADGSVVPCALLPYKEFTAGNIKMDDFEEIWFNSEIFKFFRELDHTKMKDKCPQCNFGYLCKGGCRAVAYNMVGDIYSPDPRCPFVGNELSMPTVMEL